MTVQSKEKNFFVSLRLCARHGSNGSVHGCPEWGWVVSKMGETIENWKLKIENWKWKIENYKSGNISPWRSWSSWRDDNWELKSVLFNDSPKCRSERGSSKVLNCGSPKVWESRKTRKWKARRVSKMRLNDVQNVLVVAPSVSDGGYKLLSQSESSTTERVSPANAGRGQGVQDVLV